MLFVQNFLDKKINWRSEIRHNGMWWCRNYNRKSLQSTAIFLYSLLAPSSFYVEEFIGVDISSFTHIFSSLISYKDGLSVIYPMIHSRIFSIFIWVSYAELDIDINIYCPVFMRAVPPSIEKKKMIVNSITCKKLRFDC